jgi:hypothetical protein
MQPAATKSTELKVKGSEVAVMERRYLIIKEAAQYSGISVKRSLTYARKIPYIPGAAIQWTRENCNCPALSRLAEPKTTSVRSTVQGR